MEPKMQNQNVKNEDLVPQVEKFLEVKKVLYLIHFRKSNLLYNNGSIIQIYCWFGN